MRAISLARRVPAFEFWKGPGLGLTSSTSFPNLTCPLTQNGSEPILSAPFNPHNSPFNPEIRPFDAFSFTSKLDPRYPSPWSPQSPPKPRSSFHDHLPHRSVPGPNPLRPLCLGVSVANPLVSYCCGLFALSKKVKSFAIKQIQPLLPKHPGWGCLNLARHSPLINRHFTPQPASWRRVRGYRCE